ncbi:uncharacterized protein B0I36DRAFT_356311 [Microdochium trichocladiopsis]|uniref:Uncharacterized protein n=1 Tax=Microdochium trichocladiopsis TaxID=1682393 RepID=A0A9P8XQN9_9PEZI|nr:uncharacterized protein B0I36DRAFT_356311 [Microdochium trichocladiopsis]KAH7012231.1 hypothetical protein B0I36DRAFT_356311 [Microdochium trichocladiopsis]
MPESLKMDTTALVCAIIGILIFSINVLILILRLKTRKKLRPQGSPYFHGWDNWFAIIATLFTFAVVVLAVQGFAGGIGYDLNPESEIYTLCEYSSHYEFRPVNTLTVTVIDHLPALLQWINYCSILAISCVAAWLVASVTVLVLVFINPMRIPWIEQRPGLEVLIFTHMITEVLIAILPLYPVWKLNMKSSDRMKTIAWFSIGLVERKPVGHEGHQEQHEMQVLSSSTRRSSNCHSGALARVDNDGPYVVALQLA